MMHIREIIRRCDHTLLRPDACAQEVKTLCDQGLKYGFASVCIPPCHVAGAKVYTRGALQICTVIGFPGGYSTTAAKVFETKDAVQNGADEIDLVVNLAMVKDGCWNDILSEMKEVRGACPGKLLKVIIETSALTREEKIHLCSLVSQSGADFIVASTGFGDRGATREDVTLLRQNCAANVHIKASGGINSLQDAEDFLKRGADRVGTTRMLKLAADAGLLGEQPVNPPAEVGGGQAESQPQQGEGQADLAQELQWSPGVVPDVPPQDDVDQKPDQELDSGDDQSPQPALEPEGEPAADHNEVQGGETETAG